jgi:hypothetical protein
MRPDEYHISCVNESKAGCVMRAFSGIVLGVVVVSVGIIGGWWLAGPVVGLVLGGASALCAVAYGRGISSSDPYATTPLGVWRLVIDATWSCVNTWAAAIYYAVHRLTGNQLDPARSEGSGSLWLVRGTFPGFATTIGNVKAGSDDFIDRHEQFHVFQARLLGPFYIPAVALNYVLATVVPYWLLFNDKTRRPISGFATYFLNGVYPHVWNEAWAYKRDESGTPR